ncbi:MAG: VOC family protein [Armatimonadetes bacterium]|nr:VOC family protein [Armatimonadota bacterium]
MLKSLSPDLMVRDVNEAAEYYHDVLGFEVVGTHPEAGSYEWAMVKRDNVTLMFERAESVVSYLPHFVGRELGGSGTLFIEVTDLKSLYESVVGRAKVLQEPKLTFYGMNEFMIEDPNGYILVFAERAA